MLATTYVAGQLVSLPLFVAIYARRWGKFGWAASITYAAVSLLAGLGTLRQDHEPAPLPIAAVWLSCDGRQSAKKVNKGVINCDYQTRIS